MNCVHSKMNFTYLLTTLWEIFKTWWWIVLPFIFYPKFVFFWKWYQSEQYDATVKKVVLEIKIPKEVVKPMKAMEQVIAGFHGVHDVFTWREEWLQGEFQLSISLEIASIDGKVHFYIRIPEAFRDIIESNIYSQYPDAEIFPVEDYTRFIPQPIPNKDWEIFGFDFVATKPSCYPIKTFRDFEEVKEPKEEKRLDPLANLLEGMATIGEGEQMWLQIGIQAVRDEWPWQQEGLEIVGDLVHREKKETTFPSIFKEAADVLVSGKPPGQEPLEKEDERELIPPEMKLTPGERLIVQSIEENRHCP